MSELFESKINVGMSTTLNGIEVNGNTSEQTYQVENNFSFEPETNFEYKGKKRDIQNKPKVLKKEENTIERNLNTNPIISDMSTKTAAELPNEVEGLLNTYAKKPSLFDKLFKKRK